MIVTYNWLKEFVDFDFSVQELCDKLTMAGLEVESLEEIGGGLDSVIVAKLEAVEQHPDADRLTVCQVNNGKEVVQVVCGATNHKTGDLIALAQPGSVLPGDFKIKKSKIRGQVSMGMLCSESELGLATDSAGIMILPQDLPLGVAAFDALNLKDYRIEIGLTPNRPDCLSVVGVAREVAAMCGKQLTLPVSEIAEADESIENKTSIAIEDSELCPRYAARMIKGVKIGPSPDWLVRRLEAVGTRSINNIVDVTNYVMFELGHPLHAFDYKFLKEGRIVVKRAEDQAKFFTLDDQERTLSHEDLMICDGQGPVAIGGVMGGQNSEVQEDTDTILLEAAYFKPTSVRRSSKRHGLHTEASHRFERGADIDMIPCALDRAASLMAELGQGQVLGGVADNYPAQLEPLEIELSVSRTKALLDVDLDTVAVSAMLKSIELTVEPGADSDQLKVRIPSFRPDIEREVDLIEEVARLYGYDNIPVTMPTGTVSAGAPKAPIRVQRQLRRMMVENGFSEAMNYSFIAADAMDKITLDEDDVRRNVVTIMNPLSEDQAVMRTTHVSSLLETVARNLNYRSTDLRLFELRPVFLAGAEGQQRNERLTLTAVISGRRDPEGWAQSNADVDFFDLKGVVEAILQGLNLHNVSFDGSVGQNYFHPGKSCGVMGDKKLLGYMGEIHPQVASNFDVDQAVYLFELDVDALIESTAGTIQFKPLSRFPDVIRDSALLLDDTVEAAQIMNIVERTKIKFLENVTLFDLYTGKGVAQGKKSVAIRVRYRDLEKTLTEQDVTKAHDKLIRSLCHQLGAEIR